ncbi:MAG: hypothetical protein ACRDRL_31835 [Sciscionella sp.]
MTMRTIPVDLGKLEGFTLALLPAPYTDRESGEPRKDRGSGLPLYLVGVNVSNPQAREAYSLMIQVAGEPAGLALNQVVMVYDLTASPWDRDGRSGVTYRASAITPVTVAGAAVPTAAETPATGRASGRGAAS